MGKYCLMPGRPFPGPAAAVCTYLESGCFLSTKMAPPGALQTFLSWTGDRADSPSPAGEGGDPGMLLALRSPDLGAVGALPPGSQPPSLWQEVAMPFPLPSR